MCRTADRTDNSYRKHDLSGRTGMTERAVAIRLSSRPALEYVRWARRTPSAAVVLALAALFVQPPVQAAAGIPSKADPALYTQAKADSSRTFPVILRESQPGSTA